ncbi:serine hydrolase [Cryptosporangium aurantiacum]|uniref:Beta-lactamase enzyme family protein n=1 Tax=Cryptosporangium aurantiacum TaxID=134849 RepID=A0A1M7RPM5_9ACTN|nr:serine hydrolase [Cryptosporangium aurantiacum]SHN48245.1 Beta-lactamase enzyme family protein [Cryptosporangium aurantiacum]
MTLRAVRRAITAGFLALVILFGGLVSGERLEPGPPPGLDTAQLSWQDERLARDLLRAVGDRSFVDLVDVRFLGLPLPPVLGLVPNVDTTVIELDALGRPLAAATVLLSARYREGLVIPLDENLSTDEVRWRRWDDAAWSDNAGQGTVDVVPGRERAPVDFMAPYPASVFKLMVAFGVLRLADRGAIDLDEPYAYAPVGEPSAICKGPRTATVRSFLDAMITVSSNPAACAMVKLLHDRDAIGELNQFFANIGLATLQLRDTDPRTGGNWTNAITMTSIDTAKLLLLLRGAPGVLWRAPDGAPVTRDVLSPSSSTILLSALGAQGLNQVLSTTNWCGRPYPAQGIPQTTPARWMDPQDGTVRLPEHHYGRDVRPCNNAAEVTFAHKTGLAETSGGDAGIVSSLPGKPWRSYIVVVQSNLGSRFVDPARPEDPPGVDPVEYSEKFAELGRAVDDLVTAHRNPPAGRRPGV